MQSATSNSSAPPSAPGVEATRPTATRRDDFLDYLKGILIVLVVYGHVIQGFGYREKGAFDDPVFAFIYIFHMPLFMVVSGYLAEGTFKKYAFTPFFTRKLRQLILPVLTWSVFFAALYWVLNDETHALKSLPTHLVKDYILGIFQYWFIWALFVGFLGVFICRQFGRFELGALVVANFLVLLLPEGHSIENIKYVFPFFCIGYLMSKAKVKMFELKNFNFAVFSIISLVIYLTWNKIYLIYVSGMSLHAHNVPIILHRFFAGLIVSWTVCEALRRLHARVPSPLLSAIGQNTLALYIVEVFFLQFAPWVPQSKSLLLFHLLIGPVIAAAIIFIIMQVVKVLALNPRTRLYFLGQETRKPTEVKATA